MYIDVKLTLGHVYLSYPFCWNNTAIILPVIDIPICDKTRQTIISIWIPSNWADEVTLRFGFKVSKLDLTFLWMKFITELLLVWIAIYCGYRSNWNVSKVPSREELLVTCFPVEYTTLIIVENRINCSYILKTRSLCQQYMVTRVIYDVYRWILLRI